MMSEEELDKSVSYDPQTKTVTISLTLEQITLLKELVSERVLPILEDYEGYPPQSNETDTHDLTTHAYFTLCQKLGVGEWGGLD